MSTVDAKRALRGNLDGSGLNIAIVAATFNHDVVDALHQGCVSKLKELGVCDIETFFVPGALELPLMAQRCAEQSSFSAIIAIGCVIKGGTDHYQYVSSNAVRALVDVSLAYAAPIAQALLTVDDHQQAMERAGGPLGNKGADAAEAAVLMARATA